MSLGSVALGGSAGAASSPAASGDDMAPLPPRTYLQRDGVALDCSRADVTLL